MGLRELMICMILSEKNSVDKFYAAFVVTSYFDESNAACLHDFI